MNYCELLSKSAPALAPWLGRAWLSTCRLTYLDQGIRREVLGSPGGFITVLWHQHLLLTLEWVTGRRIVVLTSRSRDGTLAAQYARRLGHRVVHGSSSAGGADALRRLIRLVAAGNGAVVTADGPKGPPRVAKPGCVLAAMRADVPLVPMGIAISRAYYCPNWDRTAVPLPGSHIVIGYGEPIYVAQRAHPDALERARRLLEQAMAQVEVRCNRFLESETQAHSHGELCL